MTLNEMSCSEVSNLVDEWIKNERYRRILKRRWLDGITFDRLAEEFDLSVRQVKNIVYRSEKQLLRHI